MLILADWKRLDYFPSVVYNLMYLCRQLDKYQVTGILFMHFSKTIHLPKSLILKRRLYLTKNEAKLVVDGLQIRLVLFSFFLLVYPTLFSYTSILNVQASPQISIILLAYSSLCL